MRAMCDVQGHARNAPCTLNLARFFLCTLHSVLCTLLLFFALCTLHPIGNADYSSDLLYRAERNGSR